MCIRDRVRVEHVLRAAAADDVERVPQARRRLGGPELADRRDAGVQRLRVAALVRPARAPARARQRHLEAARRPAEDDGRELAAQGPPPRVVRAAARVVEDVLARRRRGRRRGAQLAEVVPAPLGARLVDVGPAWASNFGRPTPSTRRCRRDRVGSMAWRFTKVHAIFLRIT